MFRTTDSFTVVPSDSSTTPEEFKSIQQLLQHPLVQLKVLQEETRFCSNVDGVFLVPTIHLAIELPKDAA